MRPLAEVALSLTHQRVTPDGANGSPCLQHRHHNDVAEGLLVLRVHHAGLEPVHERADRQAETELLVALGEELLLEPLGPVDVLGVVGRHVPDISDLEGID
eukprot:scaffold256069_cov21-Prasinocladus_malaysianus.AAC.1